MTVNPLETFQRRVWLAMLAKLVAPADRIAAATSLGDMLPMLEDFPDPAWTRASLDYVATRCRHVPPYSQLRTLIGEWWQANRPSPKALTDPNSVNLSERGRAMLRYWNQRKAAGFPPIPGRPDVTDVRAHSASLVRQVAPEAWAVIERGEAA